MTALNSVKRLEDIAAARTRLESIRPDHLRMTELRIAAEESAARDEYHALIRAALREGVPVALVRKAIGAASSLTWRRVRDEAGIP